MRYLVPIAITALTRNWPKLMEMDPETKQRVDAMWSKLGVGPHA